MNQPTTLICNRASFWKSCLASLRVPCSLSRMIATKVWVIEDGVLIPYLGNYTDYRTRKRPIVLDVPEPLKNNSAPTRVKTSPSPSPSGQKKQARVKVC